MFAVHQMKQRAQAMLFSNGYNMTRTQQRVKTFHTALRVSQSQMVQPGNSNRGKYEQSKQNNTAMFLLAPMALALYMSKQQEESQPSECYNATRSEKIRGNYENKIRFFSPPEKSFEIFAGEKTEEGEMRMTYKDFLHAMTPYCYTPFFEE